MIFNALKRLNLLESAFMIWALLLPFDFSIVGTYILFLAFFYNLIINKFKVKVRSFSEAGLFYVLIIYGLYNALSLIYTQNFDFGLSKFEKRLPLIIVGLIGIFNVGSNGINIKGVASFYLTGISLAFIIILINTYNEFFFGNLKAFINVYGISNYNYFDPIKHYTYLGVDLLMAIPLLFFAYRDGKNKNLILILYLLVAGFLIYLTGAKIILISFLIISGIFIYMLFPVQNNSKWTWSFMVLFLIIATIFLFTHPRVQNLKNALLDEDSPAWSYPRFDAWKSGIKVVEKNIWFGVGIGDYEDELNEQYLLDNAIYNARNELNPHNQFLQTIIETGVLGLLLLLILLLLPLRNKNLNHFSLTFLLVFGPAFFVESMMIRNSGAVSFSFWLFILAYPDISFNTKNSSGILLDERIFKVLIYTLTGILMMIIVYVMMSLFVKYDFNNPKTYFASNKHGVNFNRAGDNFIGNDTGITEISSEVEFKKDSNTDFIAIPFYRNVPKHGEYVSFSLWCNVGLASNIENIYIYIYNPANLSERKYYDLSKMGEWQKLEFDSVLIINQYELGFRIEKKPDQSFNGSIKIAKPNFDF